MARHGGPPLNQNYQHLIITNIMLGTTTTIIIIVVIIMNGGPRPRRRDAGARPWRRSRRRNALARTFRPRRPDRAVRRSGATLELGRARAGCNFDEVSCGATPGRRAAPGRPGRAGRSAPADHPTPQGAAGVC